MGWWQEWLRPRTVFFVVLFFGFILFLTSEGFQRWVIAQAVGLFIVFGLIALISFVLTGSFTFRKGRLRR